MIKITEEPYEVWYKEAVEMVVDHAKNMCSKLGLVYSGVDFKKYEALYLQGNLQIVCMWDNNILVGYHLSVVVENHQFSKVVTSYDDSLYLKPDYRKQSLATKLVDFSEALLDAKGVKLRLRSTSGVGMYFKRLGYRLFESVYVKVMEG